MESIIIEPHIYRNRLKIPDRYCDDCENNWNDPFTFICKVCEYNICQKCCWARRIENGYWIDDKSNICRRCKNK